ncbi:chaplin [Streptacidiphilus pinicola]|uniref:Chaplin n=1 Tax=Streptacidiphilus pinicola TaxID=2219663 RepID=A0A2X0IUQ1_9ACTN|nr:chaplin [Streptacidiphilus pinicola]RAG87101.1 chaplin [Streptacidiphilus pinicola]
MLNTKRGLMVTVAAAGLLAAGGGVAAASSDAHGVAANSPGFLSGNLIQVPVHVPVNVCGNTVNVIALLNPAFGNHCENEG